MSSLDQVLEGGLGQLGKWVKDWQMVINSDKYKVLGNRLGLCYGPAKCCGNEESKC